MTKITTQIDGDLEELKKFVKVFQISRDRVFMNPSDNILLDGVTVEENILSSYYYLEVFKDLVFYRPLN